MTIWLYPDYAAIIKSEMRKIKLGISISLTGSYSAQGIESFQGLRLLVSDINGEGGIYVGDYGKKIPLDLIFYDDESSVDKCREITDRLIADDGVNVLLGPYSSSLALAAAEAACAEGVTLWNYGGSTDEIEERGFDCLVSAITPAGRYTSGIIKLVRGLDASAGKIAAFIARDSGFSRNVARGARLYGRENGFEVREFTFNSGEDDFSDLLDEMAEFNPDIILGMGRAHDDLLLARRLIDKGIRVKAIALVAASIKLFRDTFHEKAEGFLSASQWEKGINTQLDTGPSPDEFSARFLSAYGKEPDYVAAQGYNMGLIIKKCIEDAGTLDDRTLRETARNTDLRTFYGRFKTDTAGNQTGHEMVVVQWQNGTKVIVYPESISEGRVVYPARFGY